MEKLNNIKVTTYKIGMNYLLDIIETSEGFEAWLYKYRYSIKMFIWGEPHYQHSKDQPAYKVTHESFLNNTLLDIEDYLHEYYHRYILEDFEDINE